MTNIRESIPLRDYLKALETTGVDANATSDPGDDVLQDLVVVLSKEVNQPVTTPTT
jgi:hypothetical protein